MREALELAAEGVGRVSPNPAVGCVIVKEGSVIGRGFHTWVGVKHAETIALEQAGERAKGATVYVTLEPCSHEGRTAPCAEALIAAGVAKVVIALEDPNPKVAGQGLARLREAGIEVEIESAAAAESERMNLAFLHFMRTGKPLVTMKAAVTLDGKIAGPDDGTPGFTPGWITSESARSHVQTIRHQHDAILTGIGTVLADDCMLTDRTGKDRSRPLLRIIADSQLRLPLDSKLVTSCDNDVLVVTTSAGNEERRKRLEDAGVRVAVSERGDGRVGLPGIVDLLAKENYQSLMVEGGSRINWSILETEVADRILIYYAPKILGGTESLPVAGGVGRRRRMDAIQFKNLELHPLGNDEFAVGAWVQRNGAAVAAG